MIEERALAMDRVTRLDQFGTTTDFVAAIADGFWAGVSGGFETIEDAVKICRKCGRWLRDDETCQKCWGEPRG